MDRYEKAKENFKKGYNCSQSVLMTYADVIDADIDTVLKLAEGFGGGMGRMRLTCGAVSGMCMLAGLMYSKAAPGDIDTRTKVYAVVRDMCAEFAKKHGSVICGELLGTSMPKDNSPRPEARTSDYYKRRPCLDCVGDCAAIAEKYLFGDEE